jgi:predicted AlkP superfamily phosphohydrolase/phosphomutase
MKEKVVVIGLDGATFDTLEPLIAAGELPTFQAMLDNGVSGRLRSVVPPITTTAWASFMTGKNPGKHGIYNFTVKDKRSGRDVPANARLRSGKTLWEVLSEAGRTVLVLNVPTTYPPEKLNGVVIADFLTPKGARDFIYPQALVDEIERKFGPYPLYLQQSIFAANLSEGNVERFLQELHEELTYKFAVARYLMDQYDAEFVMLHLWGTDRIQHELWDLLDTTHPRYKKALADKFRTRIIGYFRALDAEVGRIYHRLDDDTTMLLVSDHGFGPIHKLIDLNVWLLEQGYIAIKGTPLARLRYAIWKLGLTYEVVLKLLLKTVLKWGLKLPEKAPVDAIRMAMAHKSRAEFLLSINDVDWLRTKAFCKPGAGQIFINVAGREPQGCVKPGKEYETIRQEIAAKLRRLRDPVTGAEVGGDVFAREEIYSGAHLDDAPDLTFLPLENKSIPVSGFSFITRRSVIDVPMMFGNHRMLGLLVGIGKHLQRGKRLPEASLMDIAPTILYLMGHRIPRDMDGKVIVDMLSADFLAANPIDFMDPEEQGASEDHVMSQRDEEEVINRLKDLGYL